MLTASETKEILEHLEKAQNPLFLFDNDQDGLCSFLLLQRFIGRGKGFPIKSFPEMDETYFKKCLELNADYIFILDKPLVSSAFFEEALKYNLPVVWIDHHDVGVEEKKLPENVHYYNPVKKGDYEPVTSLCYNVIKNKKDLWIAVIGSISDRYIPEWYGDFLKEYPELGKKAKDAFEILYTMEIGKAARILGYSLKDKTTNVISMLKFMMNAKSPLDILEVTNKNNFMHERFEVLDSKIKKFVERANEKGHGLSEKFVYFEYGGDLSLSADISNELSFLFPKESVFVVFLAQGKANISARGKNIRKIVLEAIKDLKNSTGGGHEDSAGAKVMTEDLEKFKNNLTKLFE